MTLYLHSVCKQAGSRTMSGEKRKVRKNHREIGEKWEKRAGEVLAQQGYQILEYNYRCRTGEIDLIAREGNYLVFCEVKFRDNTETEHPLEAVDCRKQRVISKAAAYYLYTHHMGEIPCRFDVIGILGEKIIVMKNAFEFQW